MKEISIDKVKYRIPTKWEEVTIGHQIEVEKIRNEQQHVKILALVAGYGGIPIDVLKQQPYSAVERVFSHFKWINEDIPKVDTHEFEFKGKTYKLQDDIFDMKTEEVVLILTENENHKDNPVEMYPLILAIMYRTEDEKTLDDFDVDAKAEMFKDITMPIGHSVYAFFLTLLSVQNLSSQTFSPEVAKSLVLEKSKGLRSILKRLAQDGHGNWFTRLRIGIMILYLKYFENLWDTYFNSNPSEDTTPKWKSMFRRFAWMKRRKKQS